MAAGKEQQVKSAAILLGNEHFAPGEAESELVQLLLVEVENANEEVLGIMARQLFPLLRGS